MHELFYHRDNNNQEKKTISLYKNTRIILYILRFLRHLETWRSRGNFTALKIRLCQYTCKLSCCIGRNQGLHDPTSQLSVDHGDQVPVPEAQQPGRLGQVNQTGIALRQSSRRVQVRGGPRVDCGPLAQVLQTGSGRVVGRRDTPSVRDRAGQRARSAPYRFTVRGHLRRGVDARAQLRAQLFQDVHVRRSSVDQNRSRGRRERRTSIHLVHGRALGYRAAARPSGRHEILRLQVPQVFGPHGTRNVL